MRSSAIALVADSLWILDVRHGLRTIAEMVSNWKTSLSCENNSSWVLEWMVVFHIWPTRQRTR